MTTKSQIAETAAEQLGVVYDDGTMKLSMCKTPVADANEVLVSPTLVGLCGTDRSIALGRHNCPRRVVLGHEIVGVIAESAYGFTAGTRVVVNPTMWCGDCRPCVQGKTNLCVDKENREIGSSRDGGLTRTTAVPTRAIHAIPDTMSDESAVMVEPFACIRHALSRLDLEGIERILISGGGPMGATTALQVRNRCVETVVIEPDPWRRAFLKDLGLPVRANPRRGEPFAAVIDCVGIGVPGLLEYLAPGGQLLLIGCRPEYEAHFRPFNLIQKQANIIGSCDYDDSDFTDALQDVSQRPLGHLITHNVALTSFGRAFDLLGMTSSPLYSAMKVAITAQN